MRKLEALLSKFKQVMTKSGGVLRIFGCVMRIY